MTPPEGTITALLTPPVPGAIAVIGLAGPQVDDILARVLRRPHEDRPAMIRQNQPIFCRLLEEGKALDDVVVVRSEHEGLPIAEINTHGGVRIAQRTLALLERHGAEVVSGPAFHEHTTREDPVARDVDQTLIRARGDRLVRWLLSQRSILPDYLANRSSQTDDVETVFIQRTQTAIRLIRGIHIALIGPANAGKSTLANHLIGRDEIITSDTAGTTRDWVSAIAFIRGWPVTLTDTAGLRDTACEIESEAICRSHRQAGDADLCVIVLDASAGAEACETQWQIARRLVPMNRPIITAVNKWDHPQVERSDFDRSPVATPDEAAATKICRISALQGEGIDSLEDQIAAGLGLESLDDGLPTGFYPHHLPPAHQDRADSGPARG